MRITTQTAGDLAAILAAQQAEISDAARAGVQRASTRLQAELRAQVAGAGLGRGLANAWRLQVYPKAGRTLHPTGLVYASAPLLLRAFDEGAMITARSGRYLAIPTAEAVAMGFGDSTKSRSGGRVPGGQRRRGAQVKEAIAKLGAANVTEINIAGGKKLIVYTPPRGRSAGVTRRGGKGRSLSVRRGQSVALFILVPNVRLSPRLDIDGAQKGALAYLASEVRTALGPGAA